MEKQEMARIIAMADLKERMKGKEAMALEQGKKMAEIAAEVCVFWQFNTSQHSVKCVILL
jgi:hypothetical protein